MEIEKKIYQQYRDTPYKFQESTKNNQNSEQNKENRDSFKRHDAYKELLKNIKESLNETQGRRISDNKTLRISIDKTSQNNLQENSLLNNNNILNINNKKQVKYSKDNKYKRNNVSYVNNLYKEEIEYENNNPDKNQIMNNKNENKVFWNNNNFGSSNNNQNNNNYIENKKNNKFNYNPFIQNVEVGKLQNNQINNLNSQNNINYDHNINILVSQQKNKELKTLDQKLREETIDKNNPNNILGEVYDYKNNYHPINLEKEINNNNRKNNIIITGLEPLDEEIIKYNFVLSSIPVKDKKTEDKNLAKPKNDFNAINEEKNKIIENNEDNLNQNQKNENIQNNKEFIERHNIYGNQYENNDDDKNKKCFYLKAEPIENNIQKNNIPDEEKNLETSSEIIDLDKISEYTIKTETNIVQIVRKNSKFCPILLAILLGSAGLLFLLFTSKTIRNILLNLLKTIPGFFSSLFGTFGEDIVDFLEKYNDSYRFLGHLVMIIIIWIVFRIFIKCIAIYKKNQNKKSVS